jgi:hypothetical protein
MLSLNVSVPLGFANVCEVSERRLAISTRCFERLADASADWASGASNCDWSPPPPGDDGEP